MPNWCILPWPLVVNDSLPLIIRVDAYDHGAFVFPNDTQTFFFLSMQVSFIETRVRIEATFYGFGVKNFADFQLWTQYAMEVCSVSMVHISLCRICASWPRLEIATRRSGRMELATVLMQSPKK